MSFIIQDIRKKSSLIRINIHSSAADFLGQIA